MKKWISEDKKRQITQWWNHFSRSNSLPKNMLFFNKDYRRSYPFGSLLGAVLSTVREDRDPKTQQTFPVGGLELTYDKDLRGCPGEKRQLKSLKHPLLVTEVVAQSQDGNNLILHIDPYIQAICEDEINKTCLQTGALKGTCIIMDPNSGALLACAQYPFFCPSEYKQYYNNDTIDITRMTTFSDPFEPGSIFKPITMAITLLANDTLQQQGKELLFDPHKMMKIKEGVFKGRRYKPIKDIGSHAFLNMFHAIAKSSNKYMAQIIESMIEKLGNRWYKDHLEKVFGFGHKTSVDYPCESAGFVPSLKGFYTGGAKQWSLSTPYSLGFGYNLSVTSLQMLQSWAMLINGGFQVQPHIASHIQKKESQVLKLFKNERVKVLPDSVCSDIKKALFFVCQTSRGTGKRSKLAGYSMGGKTSTVEKVVNGTYSFSHNISSFMGFSPYEKPRLLIFISIDEPSSFYLPGLGRTTLGGKCGAPMFKKVLKRVSDYLGWHPDDPGTFSSKDSRYETVKPLLQDEIDSLNRLYDEWNY